jgi:hypothetical protein
MIKYKKSFSYPPSINLRVVLNLILIFSLLAEINLYTCFGDDSQEYYVSPEGNDSNIGSIQSPWKTINHGVEQLEPGDTLILREGVYSESIHIYESGTEEGYLKIINYPIERPVIDGSGDVGDNGLVISAAYIEISGLEFKNWPGNGVWVELSHHIDISDCLIHDVGYGIGFADGSHDFTVKGCRITQFELYGFDASPSGGEDCYNGLIENCSAYAGSDPEQNVDGFALGHGDQRSFTLIDCVTYDVYDGFDISADDTVLVGCLAFSCSNAGYKIWGNNVTLMNCIGYSSTTNIELDWSGTPKTVNVCHSDFVKSTTFNIWIENHRDRLYLYNSIIACGENIGIAFEDGYQNTYKGDYNIFHNYNSERMATIAYDKEYSIGDFKEDRWTQETEQDTHSIIIENPNSLFEDLDDMNLYPAPDSPVIDNADDSRTIIFDFDSSERPNGDRPDIGAYEYYYIRSSARKIDYQLPQFESPQQYELDQDDGSENDNSLIYILALSLILIPVLIYIVRQKIL